MKEIIPFKKEVIFKTNIDEITSISLENTLKIIDNTLSGEFIISGEYKITDEVNAIDIKLPVNINIPDYNTENATIDIDDFYYEVKDNNVLFVSIDILLDKLEKIELIREEPEDIITEVFNEPTFYKDNYIEYNVYILRDGDTIDTILDRYSVTIDDLKDYNDIDNLKIGDKVIIPAIYERD